MGDLYGKVLFSVVVSFLSCEAQGLEMNMFMLKYLVAIQDYIMSGYGNGWKHCDIISANNMESQLSGDIPHITVDIKNLKTIDIFATLSSSHCLIAMYEVDSLQKLASLMKFGWRAIQHKRFALVIKLSQGISLQNAIDTKKLPFLVAAQLKNGKEQFICPVIGEVNSQEYMCDKSYVSLNGKMLHVGIVGIGPYFVATKYGMDGTDVRLLKLLAKKFGFAYNITNPSSYYAAIKMSNNREADLFLTRATFRNAIALRNNYLRPVGRYDFQFASAPPKEIQNYLTLIYPFDRYIWAFLLASVVLVTITLIKIDTSYANWFSSSTNDITYQSMYLTIGMVIDANQEDDYFHKQPCARARDVLILKWVMTGFLLTISYKSVLLANIINIEYEKGYNTVEDVLGSNKPLWIDGTSGIASLLKTDPRVKVQRLAKKARKFETEITEKGIAPRWIVEGLLKDELISIAPATRNELYIGTEIIWSRLTAFYLPKASPFERDLNIAIAWWMDTGIYFKMELDIKSKYGSQKISWTRPMVRGNQPLGFSHVLPAFIIFGVAILTSMVTFAHETVPSMYVQQGRRRKARNRQRMRLRLNAPPIMPKKSWGLDTL